MSNKWVAGWGAAENYTSNRQFDYVKDMTFRYPIFSTVDAEGIRIHLSNRFGTESCELTKATVAVCTEKASVDADTVKTITFGGSESLIMQPGEDYISDEIDFRVTAGAEIAITMYFADYTQIRTGHSNTGGYIRQYYARGDYSAAPEIPDDVVVAGQTYVFLNTVDFLTSEDVSAIIAFGDSITAMPWPDCLARRIYEAGIRNRTVIRRGIGGNRVLREYSQRDMNGYGVAGIKRFERDVTAAGVDRVFVLQGINDLLHPREGYRRCGMDELPAAEELIAGLQTYIDIAHRHGIKIYLGTIMPHEPFLTVEGDKETKRQQVNEWIRREADCDGVIDFDAALRDPENPSRLFKAYDSGDKLHPSMAGSRCMADSIPEEFIK
ncbi:MAG: lipase [Clostridia bacterium]|nr:lipase [Clostridia bacterium]